MARVIWTAEAEQWLKDIYEYIASDSPVSALHVIEKIIEKTELLTKYPELGHKYESESDENVRILLYGHYRIAYFIPSDDLVVILGVFHGSLDLDRYIF